MADYGEVLDFRITTGSRSGELHVMLKGEREKLTVWVDEYEFLSSEQGDFVVVRRARASREWVNAVLRNLVLNKSHRIPEQYSAMAKMVLNG
jgi:hypothetical protein